MPSTSAIDIATLVEEAKKNPLYYLAGDGRKITQQNPELLAVVTNRQILFDYIEHNPFSSLRYVQGLKDVPNGQEIAQKIAQEAPAFFSLMKEKLAKDGFRVDTKEIEQYYKEHPEEYFKKTFAPEGEKKEDFDTYIKEAFAKGRSFSEREITSPAGLMIDLLKKKYDPRNRPTDKALMEDDLLVQAALTDPAAYLGGKFRRPEVSERVAQHVMGLPPEDETRRTIAKEMAEGRVDDKVFSKAACAKSSNPAQCEVNPKAFPETDAGKLMKEGAVQDPMSYFDSLGKKPDFAKSETHAAITRALLEDKEKVLELAAKSENAMLMLTSGKAGSTYDNMAALPYRNELVIAAAKTNPMLYFTEFLPAHPDFQKTPEHAALLKHLSDHPELLMEKTQSHFDPDMKIDKVTLGAMLQLPYGEDLITRMGKDSPIHFFKEIADQLPPDHKAKISANLIQHFSAHPEDMLQRAENPDVAKSILEVKPGSSLETFLKGLPNQKEITAAAGTAAPSTFFTKKNEHLQTPEMVKMVQDKLQEQLKENPEKTSQRIVRTINDLHNEPEANRFRIVEGFKSDQLYGLITAGRAEIFTSSFNGLMNRMTAALKQEGKNFGDLLADEKNRAALPIFFEAAASYGRINDVLATLPDEGARKKVLSQLFDSVTESLRTPPPTERGQSEIDSMWGATRRDQLLRPAIALADTMKALKSPELKDAFEKELIKHYQEATGDAKTVYGLVASDYLKHTKGEVKNPDLFKTEDFKAKYPLPDIKSIEKDKLFDDKKRHVQLMAFHKDVDDKDSATSFEHFKNTYKGKLGWDYKDHGDFVVVKGRDDKSGRELLIVANKPDAEKGLDKAQEYLQSIGATPQFIVHRGHSFHADKTMPLIHDKTSAVFWGSCGGYQNIADTLRIAPEAYHIIGTKGAGTKVVNDPLFKMINEAILKDGRVDWEKIQAEAEKQIKDKRLDQYVLPHKNSAAIFVRAFNDQKKKEQERTRDEPEQRKETASLPPSVREATSHETPAAPLPHAVNLPRGGAAAQR